MTAEIKPVNVTPPTMLVALVLCICPAVSPDVFPLLIKVVPTAGTVTAVDNVNPLLRAIVFEGT